MSTQQQTPDQRVIDKVRKLLAMTEGRGATEAEASVAAAKAAALMEEHGLSQLTIERSGGEGETREKREGASAFGAWYEALMQAAAESCFCACEVTTSSKKMWFSVIGRQSAVASAEVLYEYLRSAVWRLSREAEAAHVDPQHGERFSARYFRHGCAERVTERLRDRHQTRLREQREEAERQQREAAARSGHPSAAPGSTALVVTLVDHAQRERDLNEDFRRGVAPGTTERERVERLAREAAKKKQMADLTAAHGWDVAWWMVEMGLTLEEATEREESSKRSKAARLEKEPTETDAQRERRRAREQRTDEKFRRQYRRQRDREDAKRSSPAFRAGAAAGDGVGLDQQIGSGSRG